MPLRQDAAVPCGPASRKAAVRGVLPPTTCSGRQGGQSEGSGEGTLPQFGDPSQLTWLEQKGWEGVERVHCED